MNSKYNKLYIQCFDLLLTYCRDAHHTPKYFIRDKEIFEMEMAVFPRSLDLMVDLASSSGREKINKEDVEFSLCCCFLSGVFARSIKDHGEKLPEGVLRDLILECPEPIPDYFPFILPIEEKEQISLRAMATSSAEFIEEFVGIAETEDYFDAAGKVWAASKALFNFGSCYGMKESDQQIFYSNPISSIYEYNTNELREKLNAKYLSKTESANILKKIKRLLRKVANLLR